MLEACSERFVSFLYNHCDLQDSKKPIYVYGCQLAFSTGLSSLSILLISGLIGSCVFGIVFLSIFISLRLFVGGFHAKSYRNCFLVTNGVFILTYAFSRLFSYLDPITTQIVLFVSIVIIGFFEPVRNQKHPVSERTFQKNKRVGMILLITEATISLLIFGITKNKELFSISSASFAAVAAMMIPPILEERRTRQ